MPLPESNLLRPRLTADLAGVCAASHLGPLRLSDVLCSTGDRGFALVLLLTTFPFVLLFNFGLATPVGFALALAALGLVAGRPAALPKSLGALAAGHAATLLVCVVVAASLTTVIGVGGTLAGRVL